MPNWISWHGGDWKGDPDQLVHVKFHDGADDLHMPPAPARQLGLAGEASNWRWTTRNHLSVVAYMPAPLVRTAP